MNQALFVLQHPPEVLAQQIALLDHAIFLNITVDELLDKRFADRALKATYSPNVCLLYERFNRAAQWIGSTVVQCLSLEQRVSVLSHMIAIAHYSKEIGNHFAGIAMVAGLDATPVKRLSRTWDVRDHFVSTL